MKTSVIVLLCLLLTCALSPARAASAEGLVDSSGLVYRLVEQPEGLSTAAITRYGGSTAELIIPPTLDSCPVTSIDDWAFSYTGTLHSITLPAGLVRIGTWVFAGCDALSSIDVEEDNPAFLSSGGVLFDRSMTSLLAYPGGKSASAYAVPPDVLFIGPAAFAACAQLEELSLPEGIVSIGESAFEDCHRLRRLHLPETLAQIGAGAFRYCSALDSLFLPPSVRQIDFTAFEGCQALRLQGWEGSYAQLFASANDIPFTVSDGSGPGAGAPPAETKPRDDPPEAGNAQGQTPADSSWMEIEGFLSSLSDWVQGSSWGILSGTVDLDSQTLTFALSAEGDGALSAQDRAEIRGAMQDMLRLSLPSLENAQGFEVLFQVEGELPPAAEEPSSSGNAEDRRTPSPLREADRGQGEAPTSWNAEEGTRENLVFIHHSVGENWLKEGMVQQLNARGYYVADITYGWREYGDHTDTEDWPTWFQERVMRLVYEELGTMSADNSIGPAPGENRIVLFKSCYPSSDVGDAVDDEKALYRSLLPYFESRPDKMFVLATPPPMIYLSTPGLTRQLCRWLTDRENGWLAGLRTGNVFVFDLYNVLTHPDAHHRLEKGLEVHTEIQGADTLYYDWDGDNHPNPQGSRKAAEEFVPLLDHWVAIYTGAEGN